MPLQIKEHDLGGIAVMEVSGHLTYGKASDQLRAKVKEVLGKGKTRLVVDLGNTSYIDSSGLGALAASFTSSRNNGASLKLANVTKKIIAILYITKLINVFEVYESVGDAVLSFGQIR
jgi:anti-sigma B factor antagonist